MKNLSLVNSFSINRHIRSRIMNAGLQNPQGLQVNRLTYRVHQLKTTQLVDRASKHSGKRQRNQRRRKNQRRNFKMTYTHIAPRTKSNPQQPVTIRGSSMTTVGKIMTTPSKLSPTRCKGTRKRRIILLIVRPMGGTLDL